MATLPPTPNLGLVLPDPGTGEPFSTTQFNGWMTTIDSALANTFTKPRLRLTDTSNASLTSTNHALQIGPTTGRNLIASSARLQGRDNGSNANIDINPLGGDVLLGDHTSRVILGRVPLFSALPSQVVVAGSAGTTEISNTGGYVAFSAVGSIRFQALFAESSGTDQFSAYEFFIYLTDTPAPGSSQLIFLGLSGGSATRSTVRSQYRYIQDGEAGWLVGGSSGDASNASIMPAGSNAVTGAVIHGHVYHALSSSERTKIEYEVVSDLLGSMRVVGSVYNSAISVDDGLRFGRDGAGVVTGRLFCRRIA